MSGRMRRAADAIMRGTRQNYEQMVQIRQENQAQYRINLYDAQNNDPLWGDGADWEDALLGGS